jgi:hypothetical protein
MQCVITKIYDRKTVGHVFTKLLQIEGTTQIFFSKKVVVAEHFECNIYRCPTCFHLFFIFLNNSTCFGRSLPIIRSSYTAWSAVVYGKRKCGRAVWCPVVSLVWSVLAWHCRSRTSASTQTVPWEDWPHQTNYRTPNRTTTLSFAINYGWPGSIGYDMIYIYIYFFTAVGLTPGGSSTSHIYTQTARIIQR